MSSGPISSGQEPSFAAQGQDQDEGGVSIRALPPRTFESQPPPKPAASKDSGNGDVIINKISRKLTQDPSKGGTQAFMHAIGFDRSAGDFEKAQVCISAVWFEGNPCNNSLNDMGKVVKEGVQGAGMVGFQTATVGVR